MNFPTRFLCMTAAAFAVVAAAQAATPQMCAGGTHSMALRTDGSVLAWGWDGYGQLGQGRLLFRAAPGKIGNLSGIRSVSSRFGGHALAVSFGGQVFGWGSNEYGQLGDGTRTNRGNAIVTANVTLVSEASAGGGFSLALRQDGSVWAWGDNTRGSLGDGTYTSRPTPAAIPGLANVTAVSASNFHALALRLDGTVWSWGDNAYGQLGDGTRVRSNRPRQVMGIGGVVAISAGNGYSLALRSDGSVWAWGVNDLGQLGGGTADYFPFPAAVPGLSGMTAISAGGAHALALQSDGSVWAWGFNGWGQAGFGPGTAGAHVYAPARVPGVSAVARIAAGDQASFAVRTDGALFAWGQNVWGELGFDNVQSPYAEAPTPVTGIAGVTAVGAGFEVSFAVVGGSVFGWGKNNYQQLATGTVLAVNQTTPRVVPGLANIEAIACGAYSSYALQSDGTLWAWGDNEWAAVGDGTFVSRSSPVRVTGIPAIASISASTTSYATDKEPSHVLALDRTGRVWVWGANTDGQLGTGGSSTRTPIMLSSLPTITAVAAGSYHSLAVDSQGRIWAWGDNTSGEIGDGTRNHRPTPVLVPGTSSMVRIAAGWNTSFAVTGAKQMWSWGAAEGGELGTGAVSDQLTPVVITSIAGVQAIAAGSDHTIALLDDGSLWAWGRNGNGQVGDGTRTSRTRPVRILGPGRARSVGAGSTISVVPIVDGAALAWGNNFNGELGDGTFANRISPQAVVGVSGGWLDLSPGQPFQVPADRIAVFPVVATGDATTASANVNATIGFRTQDQNTAGSVYQFALAPATIVHAAANGAQPAVFGKAASRDGSKAEVACVLAQLNAAGQLQGVSASALAASVTGLLSAQGQSVTLLDGVASANIAGATFYVGYGANAGAMLDGGLNRSVVSIPGSVECKPGPPQTGWWWNPAEGGRGFSIEASGNKLFMAAFLYADSGRATWLVTSGPTSLDGSLFTGDLYTCSGGQTLDGPYPGFPNCTSPGKATLAFSSATSGTLVWPGGTVPIERQPLVTGSLSALPQGNQPESGWWWNASEAGRGFFIEWQGGYADLVGYLYDAQGNPIWYIAVYPTPDARLFSGQWWQYANGQTLLGAYKPATRISDHVAPVTVRFTSAETAVLTLPGGRELQLVRHRF